MLFKLIGMIIIGGLAGSIASKLVGNYHTFWQNVFLGIGGSVVGNVVLGLIGISGHGLIGGTIVSVLGSCILLIVYNKFLR